MRGLRRGSLIFLWLVLCGLTTLFVAGAAPPSAASGSFLETFDGAPAAPTPWRPATWDVTVHSRDVGTFATLETMHAGHGSDCSAPPAQHDISSYDDAVFICRDHVMTAIKAGGYGLIYLTPNQLVDFSAGEAVVKFDVSTLRTSQRDWIDLWVTPFDENLQLALDEFLPDGDGNPRDAIHVRMDNFGGGSGFRAFVVRNFVETELAITADFGIEQVMTTSAATRTTFELRLSRTHLQFGIPALNQWWHNNTFAALGWTSGVLQLGHHSYNPQKDCVAALCAPNTWHWDNVSISSAVPFTLLRADRRTASAGAATLNFPAAAPAGARLRFLGIGGNVAISADGGPFVNAVRQDSSLATIPEERFTSYWTSIPAGTRSVQFRASNWFAGAWLVRDASIWASDAPTAQQPVPTTPPPSTIAPTAPPPVVPSPTPPAVPSGTPPPGPSGTPPGPGVPPIPSPTPAPSLPVVAVLPGPVVQPEFHSAWVDQSAYPTLAPGETATVTFRYRNTGAEAWQVGVAGRQANLGVVGDSTAAAGLGMTVGWLSPNRPATTQEAVVGPGQIGTFTFTVRAPATPGSYEIDLRPVVDGVAWLEDQGAYVIVTSDVGYHSAWVSQTPSPSARSGELIAPITLTYRNTGSSPWLRGISGHQVTLGVVGDDLSWAPSAVNWPGPDRPAIQNEAFVAPGATGSFTFQLRAPLASGVHPLLLRLVVDGVTWLEDDGVYIEVEVVP